MKEEGCKVAAYGAAAKATVLLNFFKIGSDILEYVVDRNPEKQYKVIPGTELVIYPIEKLNSDNPEIILITAWNYADEIVNQLSTHKRRGGRFIIPLPVLRIVS